jgi:hypothetical protein
VTAVKGVSRPRRPLTALFPARLAVAATAVVVAFAAATTAAYTSALPGPVQGAAHAVFAPLGVPDNHPAAGAPPTGAGTDTSMTAKDAAGVRLTLKAARARVATGTTVRLAGRVTEHGRDAAGARVTLVERLAGSVQWTVVSSAVTGPRGGFRFVSPPLTQAVVFRVTGPDGAYSAAVRVMVAGPGQG